MRLAADLPRAMLLADAMRSKQHSTADRRCNNFSSSSEKQLQ
jgi:hypothetical protein